jgi:hypothetical protein
MATVYNYVLSTIQDMEIGSCVVIPVPEKLTAFRKYLNQISQARGLKFTTRIINNELHIFRLKYANIYSKEIE